MILLEVHNRAIEELLTMQIETFLRHEKPLEVKTSIVDFDGALYYITNARKEPFLVSIKLKFYRDLEEHGIDEVTRRSSLSVLKRFFLDPSSRVRRSSRRACGRLQCDVVLRLRQSIGE